MPGSDMLADLQQRSQLPRRFGDYSILGHLATGGMAEVYIARKGGLSGFEKIVVIKCVKPELLGDKVATTQFLDEARLVATLEHPNIAQVYEVGQVSGSYFFVMEYVHGADLRQLLAAAHKANKQVSLGDALYIITHVCAALHYAHETTDRNGESLNLIHRDVSPSNVLLSHNGAVKVCDFGIAKSHGRTTSETDRGTLKGKFAYMSPEQCKAKPLDRRSDIFAIGVLLYEITTLSRLFKHDSEFDTLRAIVDEPVPLPSARTADYPNDLERIVMKALEKHPDRRYATAQELQLDLEAFAREQKLALSSVSVAKLMGELFTKRVEAWSRAQRRRMTLEDHLLDSAKKPESGDMPVFFPVGSSEGDVDIEIETADVPARAPTKSATAEVRGRPSALWLVGVVLAALVLAGVTALESMKTDASDQEARRALDGAAEKLASTLDMVSRSAHTRAESIAASPVLRAAIDTDAATLKDLAEQEGFITIGKRETIEIFQLRGGAPVSLLRMPADASALPPLQAGESRLVAKGQELFLVASAPVRSPSGVSGAIAIEAPIDLTLVKHAIGKQATNAALQGTGIHVPLLGGAPPADAIRTPIPVAAETSTTPLTLAAVPAITPATKLPWIAPVRYAAIGVGGLLLLIYVFGFLRPRS